jgi:hypothetical protein
MTEAIAQDRKRCQFLFCWIKIPMLLRSAWTAQAVGLRERFLMAPLGRTRSERRRRLALAGGIRLQMG